MAITNGRNDCDASFKQNFTIVVIFVTRHGARASHVLAAAVVVNNRSSTHLRSKPLTPLLRGGKSLLTLGNNAC